MPRRRRRLPPNVRQHGPGFRAVVDVAGHRRYGPARERPEEAFTDAVRLRGAPVPGVAWRLADAFRALLDELVTGGASPATIGYYRAAWVAVTRPPRDDAPGGWSPDTPLASISEDQARRYVAARRAAGVSDGTIYGKELQALERTLRLAVRLGQLERMPWPNLPRPRIRQRRFPFLPAERVAALVHAIAEGWQGRARDRERDADLVALLFLTGLRRAEAARLRPEDVDLAGGVVFVRGKNDDRSLPISDELRPVLARFLARAPAGGPLVGSWRFIESVLRRWQQRLDEPALHPHALRHSFAVAAVRAGVAPFDLRLLLGHVSLDQTTRYYAAQDDRARAAMASVKLALRAHTNPLPLRPTGEAGEAPG